ncbi:hypothetical protein SANTM175S_01587 [Streptomyces antimycoticus]
MTRFTRHMRERPCDAAARMGHWEIFTLKTGMKGLRRVSAVAITAGAVLTAGAFTASAQAATTATPTIAAKGGFVMLASRPWPAPRRDITQNVTTGRRIADTCARNGGELLRTISTVNEARDIDSIRRALGERKLSAWGVSYGTYVGSVYAQMFPEHTDRWVLDSNDDPDPERVERRWLANYAVGVEDTFPDFAAWASPRTAPSGSPGPPTGCAAGCWTSPPGWTRSRCRGPAPTRPS